MNSIVRFVSIIVVLVVIIKSPLGALWTDESR